jgi:AcrR family transcriptional regulator
METTERAAETGAEQSSRQRILETAWALFASEGYAEVSMQNIADAAKVNKATLYHHFGDKEQLFVAVLESDFNRMRSAIERSIQADGSFRDHLVSIANILFERSRTHSFKIMMLMHQHASLMLRHKTERMKTTPPWTPLKPLFEQEMAKGEIQSHDLDLLMTSFFGMVIFQAQRARYIGCPIPDEQLAEDLVDLFLNGVRVR